MWSADELVVIYSERVVLEPSQALMAEQWRGMGVELQPSQTRVTHTWHVEAGGTRVNVLGFNIRQYPMKATRGYQSITTPSRQAVAQHQR
jgi:RNA-directed DNA polymerase